MARLIILLLSASLLVATGAATVYLLSEHTLGSVVTAWSTASRTARHPRC